MRFTENYIFNYAVCGDIFSGLPSRPSSEMTLDGIVNSHSPQQRREIFAFIVND